MSDIFKELYVCDNCQEVQIELFHDVCPECGKGTLICTDFVPESQLKQLRTTLAEREADLDKLVRYLIGSGLVKVDDMPNSDAIKEAIAVMGGMQDTLKASNDLVKTAKTLFDETLSLCDEVNSEEWIWKWQVKYYFEETPIPVHPESGIK